jgi:hypothetical protein
MVRGVGGRILGFHLDDERCTGPDSRFGNASTVVPPCLAVLQEYALHARQHFTATHVAMAATANRTDLVSFLAAI